MAEEFIGNYRVLRKIGAGGTAQVFLAVHKDVPNLKVILKILSDSRLQERFLQEADKLALLDGHPNICQIKHFFSHGDDMVIAMEYIDGQPLDKKIKAEQNLGVRESLEIICKVLHILQFAHNKRIFHRDIKPSNIMIDNQGKVKVIDFGIAKAETDPNLTAVGTACGTPAYMAPEQFNPDAQTKYGLVDIYAAGTTLYAMLAGRVPYTGDNPFAIRDAKLFEEPPSPRDFNPEVSRDLEAIILKSIAREPAERYQSPQEMIDALEKVASPMCDTAPPEVTNVDPDQPTAELTAPVGTASPPPTGMSPGRPKWLVYGIGAAVVVAVAVVIAFMGGEDELQIPPSPSDTTVTTASADGPDTLANPPGMSPTGTIAVVVSPHGDIYLDDSLVASGSEEMEIEADTGRHIVRVENSKSQQKRFVDTLYLAEGFTSQREYRFTFPPPPDDKPKPSLGQVRVWTWPDEATVYIDGKKQEYKTNFTYEVPTGRHTIRTERDTESGVMTADTTLLVKADSIHVIRWDFRN